MIDYDRQWPWAASSMLRVASRELSIYLLEIEERACWVPVVKKTLFATNSRPFGYQRKARPTMEGDTITKRRSMLGIKGQREAGSTIFFDGRRFSMLDTWYRREARPTSVPLPRRNRLFVGLFSG